jgi:hypothetical protein
MRKTQESSPETIELAAKGIQTVDHGAMESQKFSLTKSRRFSGRRASIRTIARA